MNSSHLGLVVAYRLSQEWTNSGGTLDAQHLSAARPRNPSTIQADPMIDIQVVQAPKNAWQPFEAAQ
jgi:hypothetical protein